ncbi:MAG: hypothetical protein OJF49_000341 [Ktedonobacterales bacterium]|nr:MAG: hypothetical protein OJF49_000341 [Ktedonobacterales bacterium]
MNESSHEQQDHGVGSGASVTQAPQPTRMFPTVFASALVGAACGAVAALVARYFVGIPTSAELFGDRLTALVPLPLFETLLRIFGSNAKHFYFGGVLIGQCLLTAVAGTLYWLGRVRLMNRAASSRNVTGRQRPGVLDVLALVLGLWLLSAGVLAALIGGGWFGADLTGGASTVFVSELPANIVFALVFVWMLRRERVAQPATELTEKQLARRTLLKQGLFAAAVLTGGAVLWEALSSGLGSMLGVPGARQTQLQLKDTPSRIVPPPTPEYGPWQAVPGQTPEVTFAGDFYYVSKNLVGDPQIDAANWQLAITGQVKTPYSLSYDELRQLPQIQQYHTLECISNEVGGDLMSNALWTGVSLADVLNRAGIQQGASEVIFRAADGYSDALHLSQALDERSLIVYQINGAPLPHAHGFPARLLIPGLYGMKNGKWLTSLDVGPGSYAGYWEQRGWTPEALVKMTSRIDLPHDGDLLLAKPMYIAGVAYSGDKGIARVDVSTDGGQTWQQANLKRPLGELTWVLWEMAWTPASGSYAIVARAIDLDGNVQTPAYASTLPDGASGYDAVSVVVR